MAAHPPRQWLEVHRNEIGPGIVVQLVTLLEVAAIRQGESPLPLIRISVPSGIVSRYGISTLPCPVGSASPGLKRYG
jgi:hypothetical protein